MGYIFTTVPGEPGSLLFKYNGQFALKNYNVEIVNGNRLKIISTTNEMFSLLEAEVTEIEINGTVYTDPSAAQYALQSLVFSDETPVILSTLDKETLISGFKGSINKLTPTPTSKGFYIAEEKGIYSNINNLEVREGFLTLLIFDSIIWTKAEVQLPQTTATGSIALNETAPISGDTAYKILIEGKIVTAYNTWEAGYYFNSGAASTGNNYGMQRTPKSPLKKGETLKSGVNTFNVSGSSAAILNIYNLDGTFKANLFKQSNYLDQFKQIEYMSDEDVLFSLCDFPSGNHGQKYIEIHSLSNTALEPLDDRTSKLEKSVIGSSTLLPEQIIPITLNSFYYYHNGAVAGTATGHKHTEKFLLQKGRTVECGVNIYTSIASIAIANAYKLDGTFLGYVKRPDTQILGTFYVFTYTAVEDVLIGVSDYEQGAYGTAYVKILQTTSTIKGLDSLVQTEKDNVKITDFETNQMYLRGRALQNLSTVKKYGLIVAGQSNSEGRVPIAQLPSYISSNNNIVPNVQMWNDNAKVFQPFKFGSGGNTGQEAPGATPSPSSLYAYDAIASYLLAQNKSQTIYLIKRAMGGTAISPNGIDGGGFWTAKTENIPAGKNKLIEEFKTKILNALAATPDLEIKACLWHQGESDSPYPAAVEYYQNFKDVIAYIRGIVGNPKMPFIFGTIAPISKQYSSKVNDAFYKVYSEDPFVYLINMSDGALLDDYHFDATSTQNLGTRMFDVLKNL